MDSFKLHVVMIVLPAVAGWLGSKLYDLLKGALGAIPPQAHVALVGLFAVAAPFVSKWIPDFPLTLDGLNAHAITSAILLIASQITHATKMPSAPAAGT